MSKLVGIMSAVLGMVGAQWLLGQFEIGNCASRVDEFRAAYEQQVGSTRHGEIAKSLKQALEYCEAGQPDKSNGILSRWQLRCRMGGCE